MALDIWQLLFDFGLVVLIWLVQLIIYPSFCTMQSQDLVKWHVSYTQRISIVVIPLMLGQLFIVVYQVWNEVSPVKLVTLVLVLVVWLITFLFFIPAHNKIASGNFDQRSLKKMVRVNWWRTVLWSLVFLINLIFLNGV